VHQVCDPNRAATYMRIGDTRYRWEFQLLPGETTDDFGTLAALRPLIAPWVGDTPPADLKLVRERGSELARWLRRGHATAAIIRPDRTVMCAGRNLSALCEVVPRFVPSEYAQPNPIGPDPRRT
jgi:hypothetical protein